MSNQEKNEEEHAPGPTFTLSVDKSEVIDGEEVVLTLSCQNQVIKDKVCLTVYHNDSIVFKGNSENEGNYSDYYVMNRIDSNTLNFTIQHFSKTKDVGDWIMAVGLEPKTNVITLSEYKPPKLAVGFGFSIERLCCCCCDFIRKWWCKRKTVEPDGTKKEHDNHNDGNSENLIVKTDGTKKEHDNHNDGNSENLIGQQRNLKNSDNGDIHNKEKKKTNIIHELSPPDPPDPPPNVPQDVDPGKSEVKTQPKGPRIKRLL